MLRACNRDQMINSCWRELVASITLPMIVRERGRDVREKERERERRRN
jgi:hypothetical protein